MADTKKAAAVDAAVEEAAGEAVPGLWVQYVNENPLDPEFETMDGYTFQKFGDAVMVKVAPDRANKFRHNRNFSVEEVPDASGIPDGATKTAPSRADQASVRKRVGKN